MGTDPGFDFRLGAFPEPGCDGKNFGAFFGQSPRLLAARWAIDDRHQTTARQQRERARQRRLIHRQNRLQIGDARGRSKFERLQNRELSGANARALQVLVVERYQYASRLT